MGHIQEYAAKYAAKLRLLTTLDGIEPVVREMEQEACPKDVLGPPLKRKKMSECEGSLCLKLVPGRQCPGSGCTICGVMSDFRWEEMSPYNMQMLLKTIRQMVEFYQAIKPGAIDGDIKPELKATQSQPTPEKPAQKLPLRRALSMSPSSSSAAEAKSLIPSTSAGAIASNTTFDGRSLSHYQKERSRRGHARMSAVKNLLLAKPSFVEPPSSPSSSLEASARK